MADNDKAIEAAVRDCAAEVAMAVVSAVRNGKDAIAAIEPVILQAIRTARSEAYEDAAKVADAEAQLRYDRARNPWPGDEHLEPFNQEEIQTTKGLTAAKIATAIRARAKEG